MTNIIQFKGLKDLEDPEQDKVKALSLEYYEKIRRLINNETSLKIDVRQYKKPGSHSTKYSIHIKALAPTKTKFEADKFDWDLARAMHKTFKALINEINHSFHKQSRMHKG